MKRKKARKTAKKEQNRKTTPTDPMPVSVRCESTQVDTPWGSYSHKKVVKTNGVVGSVDSPDNFTAVVKDSFGWRIARVFWKGVRIVFPILLEKGKAIVGFVSLIATFFPLTPIVIVTGVYLEL